MSHTHPHEAHHVKKGGHIMLKGFPCKVAEVKTSKTGKHGHAKCNITGIDVLTDKKYNEVHPGHIVLRAFDPKKTVYEVSYVEDGDVFALDEDGKEVQFALQDDNTCHQAVQAASEDIPDGKFLTVEVVEAPVDVGSDTQLKSIIIAHKFEDEDKN